ncbi:MAG: hypothetical protein WAU17_04885 [Nitrospirales bacterium]
MPIGRQRAEWLLLLLYNGTEKKKGSLALHLPRSEAEDEGRVGEYITAREKGHHGPLGRSA